MKEGGICLPAQYLGIWGQYLLVAILTLWFWGKTLIVVDNSKTTTPGLVRVYPVACAHV